MPEQTQENLRKLLEHHWNHCRHLETERAWFMNAYVVVIGGVAAFIAGRGLEPSPIFYFLFTFLIVFTFVGFFLTTRWVYAFECHRIKVNKLASILWLSCNVEVPLDPTMEIPPLHVMPSRLQKIDGIFRTRYWFALFYLFILIGLLVFSIITGVTNGFSIGIRVLTCIAGVAWVVGFYLLGMWRVSLAGIDKPKKVILAGCNGEWAQKHYLPFLIEKVMIGDITLWATDTQSEIKLNSPRSYSLWQTAKTKGRACYLNMTKDKESREIPRNVDYVFIVTPDWWHCKVAEFWFSRLSTTGKIFIEKPLDASIKAAEKLKAKKDVVYGFDHYLAALRPFLSCGAQYLARIGDIKSLKISILENDEVPPHRVQTLQEGVIFDLFPHVLAVSAAVVEKKLAPTGYILKAARFVGGARDKYRGWPFDSETCARILFLAGDGKVPVTGRVGKGIGKKQDKRMVIQGSHGEKIEFDFQNSSFSVNGEPRESLESKPVESFLEAVLAGSSIDSVPGVLSFGAAFAILEWLSDNRDNIIMGSNYTVGIVKPC